jgi:hypothetical protein
MKKTGSSGPQYQPKNSAQNTPAEIGDQTPEDY